MEEWFRPRPSPTLQYSITPRLNSGDKVDERHQEKAVCLRRGRAEPRSDRSALRQYFLFCRARHAGVRNFEVADEPFGKSRLRDRPQFIGYADRVRCKLRLGSSGHRVAYGIRRDSGLLATSGCDRARPDCRRRSRSHGGAQRQRRGDDRRGGGDQKGDGSMA